MDKTLDMRFCILLGLALFLMACPATKEIQDEDFLLDQVQLDLQGKMKPSRIEASFPSMGLKYLCTISKDKNISVFKFDTTQHSRKEIIAFLGKEVGVEGASPTLGCDDIML